MKLFRLENFKIKKHNNNNKVRPRRFLFCSFFFFFFLLCVCAFICLFCHCMFLIVPSFVASGRMCVEVLAFPGYRILFLIVINF